MAATIMKAMGQELMYENMVSDQSYDSLPFLRLNLSLASC
jgi:hypothetical protein